MNRNKTLLFVIAVGTACNLALFFTKLYIGLSVNSVCIWSDAINNLADSLSCVISLSFLAVTMRVSRDRLPFVAEKAQQLLTFVLAVIVLFVGFSFAYSSLERFMYPTPVWFQMKYFYVLTGAALAKMGMFFFYRSFARKTNSGVLRVMQNDSLLDFFITLTTLVSFTLTQFVSFAVDAVFGLAISVAICVNAAKMIREEICALLDIAPKKTRTAVRTLLQDGDLFPETPDVRYDVGENHAVAATVTVPFAPVSDMRLAAYETLKKRCLEQTGVQLSFVLNIDQVNENQGRSGSSAAEESHE